MATIRRDPRYENRHQVRYRDPDGRQRTKSFGTKVEAERWLHANETAKHRGDWHDPQAGKVKFSVVAEQWFTSLRRKTPNTLSGYRTCLDVHVLLYFGSLSMQAIRPSTLEAFIAKMEQRGAKPGTIRNHFYVVRSVCNRAIRDRAIASNPCDGVELPQATQTEMIALTAEQVERLAEAMRPPYPTLIRFAAYTGLRAGELGALRVRDVDFLRRRVHVKRSRNRADGSIGSTKNKKQRTVNLPRALKDKLAAYLSEQASLRPTGPDALVFVNRRDNEPLVHNSFYRTDFQPALRRAGLPPNVRFHDLRHTCASLLIQQGAHPKAVSEILGHSTIAITMNRYAHLYEDDLQSLTDKLDATYRQARAS